MARRQFLTKFKLRAVRLVRDRSVSIAQACCDPDVGDEVILDREENFVERVRDITDRSGVTIVYDSVGRDTFQGSLDILRDPSVKFGQSSGSVPLFEVSRVLLPTIAEARVVIRDL